jgi:Fur family ferric uptake transcriptional regulator
MAKKSRKTRQKELIQAETNNFVSLFTAEELFDKVRKKDSSIGIATVYRFLKELRKKRELHSYVCDRRMVYSRQKNSHCHFICQKCGQVIHFDVDRVDFLKRKIRGDICHFQIDVHGICDECLHKTKTLS